MRPPSPPQKAERWHSALSTPAPDTPTTQSVICKIGNAQSRNAGNKAERGDGAG